MANCCGTLTMRLSEVKLPSKSNLVSTLLGYCVKGYLAFILLVTYYQTENFLDVAIILRNIIIVAFVAAHLAMLKKPKFKCDAITYLLATILVIFSDSCDYSKFFRQQDLTRYSTTKLASKS